MVSTFTLTRTSTTQCSLGTYQNKALGIESKQRLQISKQRKSLRTMLPKLIIILLMASTYPHCSAAKHNNVVHLLRGNHHQNNNDVINNSKNSVNENENEPTLTNCLLSASNSTDCGTIVPGCVWCAEPVYGLCVSETAAKRMNNMPFFTCSF